MTTLTLPQTGQQENHQSQPHVPALAGSGKDSHLTILALDLGQKTGWALHASDKRITSGTALFRPGRFESAGMSYLRFRQWLTEIKNTAGGLDIVVFEEVRAHKGTTAAQVYGAFLGQLTAWAEHHQIPYEGVPVGTIKRHATGKGNANKATVIAAVQRLGFNPADDNEADALALLDWALTYRGGLGQ